MKKTAKKLLGGLLVLALILALVPAAALARSGMAMIVLTCPEDVWEDGSGYQMLLDKDHNTFSRIIPQYGPLARDTDSTAEVYAEFEYKLPGNADHFRDTKNALRVGTLTMQIPAGTYDWCITNPTADDSIWIVAENGDIPGRADDYVFEAGKTYTFELRMFSDGDGVVLTVTGEAEADGEIWPNVLIPEKTEESKEEEPVPADDPVDVDEPTEEEPVEEEPVEEPADEPIDDPADEPQEDVPATGDAAATALPALFALAIAAAAAYVGLRKRA